jgi:hypothetical protein
LTFDLSGAQPSLVAVLPGAVLEGGDPFALTVRSSFGAQLTDGTFHFRGDYLADLYPSGTQYGFDWSFSKSTNGTLVWNGSIAWWGGHLWNVAISNITIVPAASLRISRVGDATAQITWPTNFADYVLETATSLPALEWGAVADTVTIVGERFAVTVDIRAPNQFYRLRTR